MSDHQPQSPQSPDSSAETFFAPAERATPEQLEHDIQLVSRNPLIDTVMQIVGGLLAVLNEQRQVLAVNSVMLEALGIDNPAEILGLRPGEILGCINSDDAPNGCGTGEACQRCEAVITVLASLDINEPVEGVCQIATEHDGNPQDYVFRIRSMPLTVEDQRFVLIFLLDITEQEKQGAFNRAFFHDVSNLLTILNLNAQMVTRSVDDPAAKQNAERLHEVVTQLTREFEIQKLLAQNGSSDYKPESRPVAVSAIIATVRGLVSTHPAALGKTWQIEPVDEALRVLADENLLQRLIVNMLVNAFEATDMGGRVRLWVHCTETTVSIHVWNRQFMPPHVAKQVFHRNFSTKGQKGRGQGTYVIKLFGEKYMGGTVDFVTSEQDGTTFHVSLPRVD